MDVRRALVVLGLVWALGACSDGESGQPLPGGTDEGGGGQAGQPDAADDTGGQPDGGPDALACSSTCEDEGAKSCEGITVVSCEDDDDDGCLEWVELLSCGAGTTCVDGTCAAACPNQDCTTAGAKKCGEGDAADSVLECGDFDGDGCLEWGGATPCADNLVCSQGFCAVSCSSACTTVGATKCEGDSIVTCGDYNADGCLEWGDAQDCAPNVCSGGFCAATCTNECTSVGSQTCDGNGYKICDEHDGDGCLEWGTVVNCEPTEVCSGGVCGSECTSECTVDGATKCDLDAVTTCGDYNGDGCLEWGTPVACEEGLVCAAGSCQDTCESSCTVAGATSCEGNSVVTCGDYNGDGCLEWGTGVPCEAPLTCSAGFCAVGCTSECEVKGVKQCVAGGTTQFEACDDYNGDGCLEWGTAQDCEAGLVCSGAGLCSVTCADSCPAADQAQCAGGGVQTCGDYNGDGCIEWGTTVFCGPTEACELGACVASDPPATVIISEVMYDTTGSPDVDSFVEVYGPAGTDLSGFTLVGVNGNGGDDYVTVALTGVIGSDGLYLVAHSGAAPWIADLADQSDDGVDFQNGPDSIQVRFGAQVVDALAYGTFAAGDVAAGEGSPAADAGAGESLARDDAWTDTNDNAADFAVVDTPTPAAPNEIVVTNPPTAVLVCPGSATSGEIVTLDGSGSVAGDGQTLTSYSFAFGDGTAPVSGTDAVVTHAFADSGSFLVELTVTNDGGVSHTDSCTIAVGDANAPIVTVIKPLDGKQVTQGDTVSILIDATPAPGQSITQVELLVDGEVVGSPDDGAPYEFSYTVPESAVTDSHIALQGRATDDLGNVGVSPAHSLHVWNDAPEASFTAVVSGQNEVTCDASASSDTETEAALLEVRWDFDSDGSWDTNWSTEKVVSHVYETDGTKTITMQVRDDIGQTDTTTRDVTLTSIQTVAGEVLTTYWVGTIVLTGDVTVPAGETLTIGAGTSVLMTPIDQNGDGVGDYDLRVDGTLIVEGTADEPVIFTVFGDGDKAALDWNRIILSGTGSLIDHAIIEYAQVGLFIEDDATVTNTTVRFSDTGVQVASGGTPTLDNVELHGHTTHGLHVSGGTATVDNSYFYENGADGAYVAGGNLNMTGSTIESNGNVGLEFYGNAGGNVTQTLVTDNTYEGVRIWTDGSSNPTPTLNYNNIYGNAAAGARVVESVTLSASSSQANYGTVTSETYETPNGEALEMVRVSYTESETYGYVSGKLLASGGAQLLSYTSGHTGWVPLNTTATGAYASITDNSSSTSGTMSALGFAYTSASAVRELSAILRTGSPILNLKHNYFGAFPDALSRVTYGVHSEVNIQGFVGVPYDESWTKGQYVGGETLDGETTWSGQVIVTGDVTVPGGATLTILEGTSVEFAPIDQDANGYGDYWLDVSGNLVVAGASLSPVVFTTFGTLKSPGDWDQIRVSGGSSSAIFTHAEIEYADVGLELGSGTHDLADLEVRDTSDEALLLASASSVTVTDLTVSDAGSDGVSLSSSSNVSFDGLQVSGSAGHAVALSQSTNNVVVSNCTLTDNLGAGIYAKHSSPAVANCNLSGNERGIWYRGNSGGALTTTNIKFNDREGILLLAEGGQPSPSITGNNIFGNSVLQGAVLTEIALSASSSQANYGTVTSDVWETPGGEPIEYLRYSYSESETYGYVSGKVLGASGQLISETSGSSLHFADVSGHGSTSVQAEVTDNSSSTSGTMTVHSVAYWTEGPALELVALTDSGQVNCTDNYWGVFPDVQSRVLLARPDAIDFQGFEAVEVSGTGPQ